ncbi:wax ester/triacylglycerol synthase family O-acyltransferase [Nocardia beijingensis]|uniref:wax ester/triacylglycerol synthase family O-acyltransferase n=1 Tax=Nocardia beijingensis TaxID=95162 RepID=UPI001894B6C0|nr:wax ester/triacylglycerol synthase family O-acyltransferase [Nocardia beijingensis]MBF6469616.1 wax ester/triacylglycerol synthase family O-acyltransferase [Nocardia beijingensis]
MTELGPLDTGFMEMEDTDRRISLGIGTVAILEGPAPSRIELRGWVDRGLERHARLRQRVRRAPWDVKAPVWEEDPNFDLNHHIRWTALPEPCGERELQELIATELTERLDRDHPLWEVVVIDRLTEDRWAMILKAHHTMVDGISEITLLESFCDPSAIDIDEHRGPTERQPGTGLLRLLKEAIRAPVTIPRFAVGTVRTLAPVLYAAIAPASESSLNGPIGRQRRYTVARTMLPQVREIATAFDVTVNDVAVAAIAAAYRRLLLSRGEHPSPTELRIVVPVSTRTTEAEHVLDNRVSAMITHLPIEVDQPVERLMAVHEQIRKHRSRGEADAEKSMLSLSRRLPFGIVAEAFRLAVSFPQRGVVALATNIPGPRHRLVLGGRNVLELWPCIPIAMRVRTTIAILSYLDRLTFGITGDYDTTPDIETMSSSIGTEVAVLLVHARDQQLSRRPQPVLSRAIGAATTRSRHAK